MAVFASMVGPSYLALLGPAVLISIRTSASRPPGKPGRDQLPSPIGQQAS
jgi:hypothetical protein